MGYATNKFVYNVDPNLLCGICSFVLENPVLTPCGHSFCHVCLDTWLNKPLVRSCPECRSNVGLNESKAVISLRNLIHGLDVVCDNHERGCKIILKLERLDVHLNICGYAEVQCKGCMLTVNRCDIPNHESNCVVLAETNSRKSAEMLRSSTKSNRSNTRNNGSAFGPEEEAALIVKISELEGEVEALKREVQISEARNRVLEREFRKTKEELSEIQNDFMDTQVSDFDPNYHYGFTPSSVSELSLLIARYLHHKPQHVDADRIFVAVRRSYESYARCGTPVEHDVQMLVATACASNWFDENQRISFGCWLQSISRYQYICKANSSLSPIHDYRKQKNSENLRH